MTKNYITDDLELVPHIVLEPNDFRTDGSNKQKNFANVKRRERSKYWRESLTQSGLEHINPITKASCKVRLRDFEDDKLFEVITAKSNRQFVPDKKALLPWYGLLKGQECGVSLMHQGEPIAPAMCCCDLDNIQDWDRVSKEMSSEWTMLWNGHPWYYARHDKNIVVLSHPTENDAPQSHDDYAYKMPRRLLRLAIQDAYAEIHAFGELLMLYWEAYGKA